MTAREVRDTVMAALGESLGMMRIKPQRQPVPAISVGDHISGREFVHGTGLEAVLQAVPRTLRQFEFRDVRDQEEAVRRDWTLVLKAWDDPLDLQPGIDAVMLAFPHANDPLISPETEETIAQATFFLPIQSTIRKG